MQVMLEPSTPTGRLSLSFYGQLPLISLLAVRFRSLIGGLYFFYPLRLLSCGFSSGIVPLFRMMLSWSDVISQG